jgi:hypothetical protein
LQGWLDHDLDIRLWQGVEVDLDGKSSGRVNKLYLPKNRIVGPIGALLPLTNLRKLALWQNQLEGGLSFARGMKNLEDLDLHGNRLTGTLGPLAGLARLADVHLGANELEGGLAPLAGLHALRRLNLSANAFEGGLEGLEPCRSIETLDLTHNQGLWGLLPPALHERWLRGDLPCATAGTNIGAQADGSPLNSRDPPPVKKPPTPGPASTSGRGRLRCVVPERLSLEQRGAAAEAAVAKALAQSADQQQKRGAIMSGSKHNPARPMGPPSLANQQPQAVPRKVAPEELLIEDLSDDDIED